MYIKKIVLSNSGLPKIPSCIIIFRGLKKTYVITFFVLVITGTVLFLMPLSDIKIYRTYSFDTMNTIKNYTKYRIKDGNVDSRDEGVPKEKRICDDKESLVIKLTQEM